jgi:probable addiction module antidote protein
LEKITVSDWDAAEFIETKEDVIAYLEAALAENDPKFLFSVIGGIARSNDLTDNTDKKKIFNHEKHERHEKRGHNERIAGKKIVLAVSAKLRFVAVIKDPK